MGPLLGGGLSITSAVVGLVGTALAIVADLQESASRAHLNLVASQVQHDKGHARALHSHTKAAGPRSAEVSCCCTACTCSSSAVPGSRSGEAQGVRCQRLLAVGQGAYHGDLVLQAAKARNAAGGDAV